MTDDVSVPVRELPVGTWIRWFDDSGHEREGRIVLWLDRPIAAEGLRVTALVVSEATYILGERRPVEVVERADRHIARIEAVARAITVVECGADVEIKWAEYEDAARAAIDAVVKFDLGEAET